MYDVHQWHLANGWAGIGYHYFVAKDGKIYRGRPKNAIGSHCLGHNWDSVGVCAEGNYMVDSMPLAQENAIISLLLELKHIYPNTQIVGHRDLYQTECPGVKYPFQQIHSAVAAGKEVIKTLFRDVPEGYWAQASIERLAKLGIIQGVDKEDYKPDDPVTRAQIAVILDRLLKMLGR